MKKIILILFFIVNIFANFSFPDLNSRVVDEANIISPKAKTQLINMLKKHEDNTTNQVVVVSLKSLNGYTIQRYRLELARHWKIGQKDKNNGVVLIIAPNEKKVRIEVGYGLERKLTDALSKMIIEEAIIPNFKKNNYEQGILQSIPLILASIDNNESNNPEITIIEKRKENLFYGLIIFFYAFFVLLLSIFLTLLLSIESNLLSNIALSAIAAGISMIVSNIFFIDFSFELIFSKIIGFITFIFMLYKTWNKKSILVSTSSNSGGRRIVGSSYYSSNSRFSNTYSSRYSGGGGSFGGGASGSW